MNNAPGNTDPMADEEYYRRILQLGNDNQGIDQGVRMQLAQADAMRKGAAPQMREAGRLVVAPNIVELLGGLARTKTATDLQKQATQGMGTMRQNTMDQNMMFLHKLLGAQQPAPQPNGAPGTLVPGVQSGNGLVPRTPSPYSFGGQ